MGLKPIRIDSTPYPNNVLNQWECPQCGYTEWVHPSVWLNMWCRNPKLPGCGEKMSRTKLTGRIGCLTVFDESPGNETGR
jgi:hypothetical protein